MATLFVDPFTAGFMARALAELILLGVLCGVVSTFVHLRQLGFVADALTHTVFPGVVIGFLTGGITGIFPGSLVAGAVTAVLLTLLTRAGRVTEDAGLAVLLTAMFSVGVVLVSRRSSYTTDLTAFLFGRVLTVTRAQLIQTAVLAVIVLAVLAGCAKEQLLRAFDPVTAEALGYRTRMLDLTLNLVVALVVVAAVQAVGTALVIALLVVPAAAGRLLSERLAGIAIIGSLLTVAAGYLGLVISYAASVTYGLRITSASAVVLVLVAGYLLALGLGWPRRWRAARTPEPGDAGADNATAPGGPGGVAARGRRPGVAA
jgi:manganese/iron transport system permease protein